jgi:hypothetical protein
LVTNELGARVSSRAGGAVTATPAVIAYWKTVWRVTAPVQASLPK